MWSEYLQGTYHGPSLGWCISAAALGAPHKIISSHSVLIPTPQHALTRVARPPHLPRPSRVSSRSTAGLAAARTPCPCLPLQRRAPVHAAQRTLRVVTTRAVCSRARTQSYCGFLFSPTKGRSGSFSGAVRGRRYGKKVRLICLSNAQYSPACVVRVGIWAPRINFLPLWLPPLVGVLYE